jgi:hypothetical protein
MEAGKLDTATGSSSAGSSVSARAARGITCDATGISSVMLVARLLTAALLAHICYQLFTKASTHITHLVAVRLKMFPVGFVNVAFFKVSGQRDMTATGRRLCKRLELGISKQTRRGYPLI